MSIAQTGLGPVTANLRSRSGSVLWSGAGLLVLGRLVMIAPVRGHTGRHQAQNPLTPLSSFPEPPLVAASVIAWC